jgi:hypothetical protein
MRIYIPEFAYFFCVYEVHIVITSMPFILLYFAFSSSLFKWRTSNLNVLFYTLNLGSERTQMFLVKGVIVRFILEVVILLKHSCAVIETLSGEEEEKYGPWD